MLTSKFYMYYIFVSVIFHIFVEPEVELMQFNFDNSLVILTIWKCTTLPETYNFL